MAMMMPTASVAILGTGNLARGLATRCQRNGIEVTIGSRFPAERTQVPKGDIMTEVKVTSIDECIKTSEIIFVAMHPHHYNSLETFDSLLNGKILIDVSNSLEKSEQSNAEVLATMMPSCHVVKAFNTVSAYSLCEEFDSTTQVYVCADDLSAKHTVMQFASRLGYFPVDSGNLQNSRRLEKRNQQLFPGWGLPTLVMATMSVIWTVLAYLRYFDWRKPPYTWERLPTNVTNKIVACISITCLSFVYLPGSFAAFTQLCWGTKHKRFNVFLDRWLKMRKQLGLYALLFGLLHMVMSCVLLSPAYYGSWYLSKSLTIPANHTEDVAIGVSSRMNWVGEVCVVLGILAIATMSLLGVTSIPSIAKGMNWREWTCIQSYLGFVCLFLATAHVTVKGGASWIKDDCCNYMATVTFFSLPIPWFTILLRLILMLPCFSYKLTEIRRGWKKSDTDRSAEPIAMTIYNKQGTSSGANAGTVNQAFSA